MALLPKYKEGAVYHSQQGLVVYRGYDADKRCHAFELAYVPDAIRYEGRSPVDLHALYYLGEIGPRVSEDELVKRIREEA